MFSQACASHSVHRGEGVSIWCHFLSCYLVPCSFGRSLSLVPCSFWGSLSLVPCSCQGEGYGMVKSGWYASYLNAFLFGVDISSSYAQIQDSDSRSTDQSVIVCISVHVKRAFFYEILFMPFLCFPFSLQLLTVWFDSFKNLLNTLMSQGLLGLCCSIETRDRIERITLTAVLFD